MDPCIAGSKFFKETGAVGSSSNKPSVVRDEMETKLEAIKLLNNKKCIRRCVYIVINM